jgi:DNA-directed RNA polymerase specialized sigma24 family protein
MSRPGAELRHGFTLDDLDRLAKAASKRAFASRGLTPADRLDAAWGGILELVYAASDPPTTLGLLRAGSAAIHRAERAERRVHGLDTRDYGRIGPIPRYAAYWLAPRHNPTPEELVVDPTALRQILPQLSSLQQEALFALAAFGSYQEAADALGITYHTLADRLRRGRQRFFELWCEHQTPCRRWGNDRRAGRDRRSRDNITAPLRRRKASR